MCRGLIEKLRGSSHDDTPGDVPVLAVDLEGDVVIHHDAEQLAALRRPEQQRVLVDDVVDRDDVYLVGQMEGEAAHGVCAEELPTLVQRQLGDGVVVHVPSSGRCFYLERRVHGCATSEAKVMARLALGPEDFRPVGPTQTTNACPRSRC